MRRWAIDHLLIAESENKKFRDTQMEMILRFEQFETDNEALKKQVSSLHEKNRDQNKNILKLNKITDEQSNMISKLNKTVEDYNNILIKIQKENKEQTVTIKKLQ